MTKIPRRRFLFGAAGTTMAFIAGCAPRGQSAPSAEPSPAPTPALLGAAPGQIVITPNHEFYINNYLNPGPGDAQLEMERRNPTGIDDWRLTIDGLVDNPITLTFDDVMALPAVQEMRTLECIGNPVGGDLVGNAEWKGFYLKPVLEQVGVQPEAIRAQFAASDDYWTSVDLEWITQPGVLMAYEMNGQPLPRVHGYPLRILMPGLYGQKMPKWITGIHFIDAIELGYWEQRGWSDLASVQINSQIWQPTSGNVVEGMVVVHGFAYSAPREIVKVELGIDGEHWIEAELLKEPSPLVWTQWRAEWQAAPGDHRLSVRATDAEGHSQSEGEPGVLAGAYPDGTSAIHSVVVSVTQNGSS